VARKSYKPEEIVSKLRQVDVLHSQGMWMSDAIRRECTDHLIVLGEAHLRRVLRAYSRYYNNIRTHWSLGKDAPVSRPVHRTGAISSHAILGGLHHHYVRV
jgi:hypothetical protein